MSFIISKCNAIKLAGIGSLGLKTLLKKQAKSQVALITSISNGGRIERPAPFPWREKNYGFLHAIFDFTTDRFNENTKVIVVEAPFAAGKSEFAKGLAEELDMHYCPDPTMDFFYIDDYGFDLRKVDHLVPESCRTFDHKNFSENPKHMNTAAFQCNMFNARFIHYVNSLAHLFNTGQGVVIERSPWGDIAFAEAMREAGYMSKEALTCYLEVRRISLLEVMKPHLIIYLDVPPKMVKENIIKRGIPYEVNSKAYTDQFLNKIDEVYRLKYLKEMRYYSEILVYDWSTVGDTDLVVEDIERIDFEAPLKDSRTTMFEDWRRDREFQWAEQRNLYSHTSRRSYLFHFLNINMYDAPELLVSPEDDEKYQEVLSTIPSNKYALGYNAHLGDKGILFKSKYKESISH